MSDKNKLPSRIRTTIITTFMILVIILLNFGCHGSSSPTSDSELQTNILQDGSKDLTTDTCTFEFLIENNEGHLSRGDSCYFLNHRPMDYLDDLRSHPDKSVLVLEVPGDWITFDDAKLLMEKIDSDEPASPVVSPLSSFWPVNQTSTVGNEALFLLEGYRTGYYPPGLCSLNYYQSNKTEMRAWWNTYGKWGLPNEEDAIRIIKETYPELKEYPSDQFPVKLIKTEKAPDGWYVAFIMEGSGIPIISAHCYFVGSDRNVRLHGNFNHSSMVQTHDFSPRMCGCK